MLNRYTRPVINRIFTPPAKALLRLGLTPDSVTLIGTSGVVAGALIFYPQGRDAVHHRIRLLGQS